jgi:hypothetical protein
MLAAKLNASKFDGCHPNDLWKSYFTSSKHVHEFREKYGEPDIVQVRRIFEDKESAIAWEEKVLRYFIEEDDAVRFINMVTMLDPTVLSV